MNPINKEKAPRPIHKMHLSEATMVKRLEKKLSPEEALLADAHLEICFVCDQRFKWVEENLEMLGCEESEPDRLSAAASHQYGLAADTSESAETISLILKDQRFTANLIRTKNSDTLIVKTIETDLQEATVSCEIVGLQVTDLKLSAGKGTRDLLEKLPKEFDEWLDILQVKK